MLHLAAGRGEKSIPQAYMDTVVATRNLLSLGQDNSQPETIRKC